MIVSDASSLLLQEILRLDAGPLEDGAQRVPAFGSDVARRSGVAGRPLTMVLSDDSGRRHGSS